MSEGWVRGFVEGDAWLAVGLMGVECVIDLEWGGGVVCIESYLYRYIFRGFGLVALYDE